jgi:SOS response regulatory protein OraA/RecX
MPGGTRNMSAGLRNNFNSAKVSSVEAPVKDWRGIRTHNKPFAKLCRFLERRGFREDAHQRAMEAIDSQNEAVENRNQLDFCDL